MQFDMRPAVHHRPRPARRGRRRLLLSLTLVVLVLSVVGMHQLAFGHEMATGPTASVAYAGPVDHAASGEMSAGGHAGHVGDHLGSESPGPAAGDPCPDCGDHQMALGSCLLALTLLVLGWLLAPPRPTQVLPFLLPLQAPSLAVPVVGRLVPPLSLAELSLCRT
ncbi:hypothetical protein GCM10022197_01940 [Microlunatus spumicola]|uniref:DUF2946 domain-containing protein n=1 Tax=Microlunatus spumicola TaxID=81499 RepID=A0ABP6WFV4_9ACTN